MNQKPGLRGAALVGAVAMLTLFAGWQGHATAQDPTLVDDQLISLDADDTSVVTVLEILAERSGLNIVTATEVQGQTISIHLRNTPFEEALNLVVRAAGLGYELVGNSILVASPERLATATGLTTRVFKLEYANAQEVVDALDIISEEIRAYVSGNRVVVKAPQSIVEEVDVIVKHLDERPSQVMIEARLVEVNTRALQELGIDWERITSWTGILTEGGQPDGPTDEIPTDLRYFGLGDGGKIHRQAEAVEIAVDLLITEGNARLLANSKVTTMSNQPAEIFIGETVPVVITSLSAGVQAGGALQTIQLQEVEVGVKLEIVPRISGDGYITSVVKPEVSTIIGFVGPDNDLPQTSTRRAEATVRVRDGQKFYMGGLLSEEQRETVQKVPILGDIPLLKYLFRHYRIESTQTDLLIEITPTIIPDQG